MTRGAGIKIEFSFFAMNAVIFLLFSRQEIICLYAVCAAHELGHLITLAILGGRLTCITFTALGIVIETEKHPAEAKWRSLAVLLSGPFVNIGIFAALYLSDRCGPAAWLSLAAGVNNLLPYPQLDGGAAIALITEGTVFQRTADIILFAVRLGISAALLAASVVIGMEILPFFIASVILFLSSADPHKPNLRKKRDA